jgi:hypothetical protein
MWCLTNMSFPMLPSHSKLQASLPNTPFFPLCSHRPPPPVTNMLLGLLHLLCLMRLTFLLRALLLLITGHRSLVQALMVVALWFRPLCRICYRSWCPPPQRRKMSLYQMSHRALSRLQRRLIPVICLIGHNTLPPLLAALCRFKNSHLLLLRTVQ